LNNAIKVFNFGTMARLTHELSKNRTDLRSKVCEIRYYNYMADYALSGELAYAERCDLRSSGQIIEDLQLNFERFREVAAEPTLDEAGNDTHVNHQIDLMVDALPPIESAINMAVRIVNKLKNDMSYRHNQGFCVYKKLLEEASDVCKNIAIGEYQRAVRSEYKYMVTTNTRADIMAQLRKIDTWLDGMRKDGVPQIRHLRKTLSLARASERYLGSSNFLEALAQIRDYCEDIRDGTDRLNQVQHCHGQHLHWVG